MFSLLCVNAFSTSAGLGLNFLPSTEPGTELGTEPGTLRTLTSLIVPGGMITISVAV